MSHIAAPHIFDQLGFLSGMACICAALLLRFGFKRAYPPKYSVAPMLAGIALVFTNAEALHLLSVHTVLVLRFFVTLAAFAFGPGLVLWVYEHVEPGPEALCEDDVDRALRALKHRFAAWFDSTD